MTTLRTAAQQALEALTPFVRGSWTPGLAVQAAAAMDRLKAALAEPQSTHSAACYQWHHKCAIAEVERLRAALAEPAQEPVKQCMAHGECFGGECIYQRPAEPVQEHDLSRCPKCNGPADNGHDREVPPNPYYCTKCMAEPVAWRTFDGEGGYDYRAYEDNENYAAEWAKRNPRHVGWVEPLYTAPQRKPLTDEQIERLWYPSAVIAEPGKRRVAFGRAVERAHGIGGEG